MFSPDGSMLALSWAPSLAVDLDGKDVLFERAKWVENLASTAWSPHGVYVAFTARGLWLANVMTKSVRRLTPFADSKPSWSPDGKVIAATRSRDHLVALVRVKDGKVFKRFPRSNGNRSFASWSPAGEVAFAHENNCGIDIADEDGTHRRRLTRAC